MMNAEDNGNSEMTKEVESDEKCQWGADSDAIPAVFFISCLLPLNIRDGRLRGAAA